MRHFFRTSFGGAVLGGAVVGLLFAIAIAAGWIESDGSETSTVSVNEPLTSPVASTDGGDEGGENAVNQIYRRDGRGVAFVSAKRGGGEESASPFGLPEGEGGTATGSGFLIDSEGHLITNSHVVDGASDVEVTLGASDESYPAKIVGNDPATDVALLEVDAPEDQLHPLALADSSQVEVGDPVVAIGNPFGLDNTVTTGIVSAVQRQIQAPNGFSISQVIQTDAAINPGNSGGPLIDMDGRVIGINSQIQTGGSSGNVGIGFAVPINTAKDVVEQIESGGKVRHAYLGISGGSITASLAKALDLPVEEGVLVNEVVKGGPSDEAGLKGGDDTASIEGADIRVGGDIIVKVNGDAVMAMDEVIEAVNAAQPGDKMVLTVRRGDQTKTISVELGVRPASAEDTQSGPVGPPSK
jgi:S1-C subfamily serine protease